MTEIVIQSITGTAACAIAMFQKAIRPGLDVAERLRQPARHLAPRLPLPPGKKDRMNHQRHSAFPCKMPMMSRTLVQDES
jgi:hypothetical protein